MSQPVWELIGQLGDVNPLDYGGYFIYRDTTGVYCEEGEILFAPNDDEGTYEVYRFILERCTHLDGIVSDNKYHPAYAAWFAKPELERVTRPQDTTYLKNVADCMGTTADEMIEQLCSDDPLARAQAYRDIGNYHGFDNLDSDPLRLTRKEAEQRYKDKQTTTRYPHTSHKE